MSPFDFQRADDVAGAVGMGAQPGARYLGGGTNLVDLMRENIEHPGRLVDVTGLSRGIAPTADGGLRIGAGETNAAVAADRRVRETYPMLAQAILSGASGQVRNMATVGGNLLQRTRCGYFYDVASRCNKRAPGAGCDALEGLNRNHAVLGASSACVATHPSDMAVALAALDAGVQVQGPDGAREIALLDLHRLPGDTPQVETVLRPGELIVAVTLPPSGLAGGSTYRKLRDRASFAFALVSLAAGLWLRDGVIAEARLALGGVAARPWRAHAAEAVLTGRPASAELFRQAAAAELAPARALRDNGFKIELAQRLIERTLTELVTGAGLAGDSPTHDGVTRNGEGAR
ncbi:FAD binding domain-containing protein [Caulobacter sp. KR2-114]|uniref:FAD binding domain-containing protein n=1 Tax=Caulobacter sp. KR2-114 TaxID=3400912 RepID=UPI003C035B96